ncbi:unnamed protein product [Ectocarpus sp. 13 AM-2016]
MCVFRRCVLIGRHCTVTMPYPQRPLSGGQEDGSPQTSWSPGTLTHEFEVTVKYLRREIRDLPDRDRETFLQRGVGAAARAQRRRVRDLRRQALQRGLLRPAASLLRWVVS